jgi:predicted ATPase
VITPVGATPPIEVPIVNTGEGMAQLLPVVVLGCLGQLGRLPEHSIVAIEHPELHLHPAAHAALAELFCQLAALDAPPTAVIETHSENFLLRVQIAIARGDLPANKVVVHWIRALDGGSVVDTITFDEAARPRGAAWPPGVFSEDLEQARELLKIRKARGFA